MTPSLSQFLSLLFLQHNSTCKLPYSRLYSHPSLNYPRQLSLTPSNHFPVFTKLPVTSTTLTPPTFYSFPCDHSKDVDSFLTDLSTSQLIINPPKSLDSLFITYYSTLIICTSHHHVAQAQPKSNPWFTSTLCVFRFSVCHAENASKIIITLLLLAL